MAHLGIARVTLGVEGVRFRAVAYFEGSLREVIAVEPTAHGALYALAKQFEAIGKGGMGDAQRIALVREAIDRDSATPLWEIVKTVREILAEDKGETT